jgi:phytol kinase
MLYDSIPRNMTPIIDRIVSFFVDNFPSWQAIAIGSPLALSWAYLCLSFAGHLKRKRRLKTGYTRKVFHFLIFTTAAVIHGVWGTPIVCLFGGMTTLVVFYAVFRGAGHPLYEAMAREKDAPHRTYFIVAPYFATLIGGLSSNMLFGGAAMAGYLVAGFGDAIGEPVGTRLGKHTYRVPSLSKVKAVRSLEGSAAVFTASLLALTCAALLCPEFESISGSLWKLPLLAIICAVVEAFSPHGWDNLTMQVIPSWLALSWS